MLSLICLSCLLVGSVSMVVGGFCHLTGVADCVDVILLGAGLFGVGVFILAYQLVFLRGGEIEEPSIMEEIYDDHRHGK